MKNLIYLAFFSISTITYAQDYEQASATNGLFFGVALGSTGWSSETFSNDEFLAGFAFNLEAGYGFTEKIAGFVRFEMGPNLDSGDPFIPSYPSTQIELGARWHFLSSTKSLRPFFQLSGSRHQIKFETYDDFGTYYDVSAAGVFIGVGGGLHYFVRPSISLFAQLHADFGSYNTILFESIDLMESHSVYTTRFSVGAKYHLSGR